MFAQVLMGTHFRRKNYLYSTALAGVFLALLLFSPISSPGAPTKEFKPIELINHHILDAHSWDFWEGKYGTLYLPVILYSQDRGLEMFSSRHLVHLNEESNYKGYHYAHGHIQSADTSRYVWDFSITKNVAFLFLEASILLLLILSAARGYRLRPRAAPRGIQSALEPVILFVRDDIVKPCIGPKYRTYLPYMLTLFFFILLGNLMGLLPGAANLTV